MLESWRIPRELVVFGRCWNDKEVGSNIRKGMFSNRVDELASGNKNRKTRTEDSFCILSCGQPLEDVAQFWGEFSHLK